MSGKSPTPEGNICGEPPRRHRAAPRSPIYWAFAPSGLAAGVSSIASTRQLNSSTTRLLDPPFEVGTYCRPALHTGEQVQAGSRGANGVSSLLLGAYWIPRESLAAMIFTGALRWTVFGGRQVRSLHVWYLTSIRTVLAPAGTRAPALIDISNVTLFSK